MLFIVIKRKIKFVIFKKFSYKLTELLNLHMNERKMHVVLVWLLKLFKKENKKWNACFRSHCKLTLSNVFPESA